MTASEEPGDVEGPEQASRLRKRPKPGERRLQILHALAHMLEQPGVERITTSALAARIGVSEAALYRHFASKAQMFESLIEFVEQSALGLIRQVTERETPGPDQAGRIATLLLQFFEKNPGMCRLVLGDALLLEHQRLQERVNLLFDKIEAQLRQSLRGGGAADDPAQTAALVLGWMQGSILRYTRSGFRRPPTQDLQPALARLL